MILYRWTFRYVIDMYMHIYISAHSTIMRYQLVAIGFLNKTCSNQTDNRVTKMTLHEQIEWSLNGHELICMSCGLDWSNFFIYSLEEDLVAWFTGNYATRRAVLFNLVS